ncbi:hypothetical protein DdX_04954 [Ditylenchus destructor]|uniref:Domain of unknown function DB domain-containing protein n=1 Tax=Ditylenchus destructor TaxID=166010 RepID=A0AAD4N7B2_9BILA|nr:hypothetical protein DdX_04954 [Ditylenchus destructor]
MSRSRRSHSIAVFAGLFTLVFGSEYFQVEDIRRGVTQCCPADMTECCMASLSADQRIQCGEQNRERSVQAAMCLEHFFFNDSIIERGAYKCCWLLSSPECRRSCANNLQSPTLLLKYKFTFTDACPLGEHNNETEGKFGCLYAKYKLHNCFSSCVRWMREQSQVRRATRATHPKFGLRTNIGEDDYDPYRHCSEYREFIDRDPCVFPVEE